MESSYVEDAKAALWNQISETIKESLVRVYENGKRQYPSLQEHDHQKIRGKMERIFQSVMPRLEQDPELPGVLQLFLGYPTEAMEKFIQLFAAHFRQSVIEEKGTNAAFPFGEDTDIASILDLSIEQAGQCLEQMMRANKAISEAIHNGEYDRAEKMVRGKMAMEPNDIGMLNYLFTIACLSGNADLLVETLNMTMGGLQPHVAPELVSREGIGSFLQTAIAENILLGTTPLLQSGLVIGSREFSQSQRENLRETAEAIITRSVEEIILQLAASREWTAASLVAMCKNAVAGTCKVYEKWLPGITIVIQWKGEEFPECARGRAVSA